MITSVWALAIVIYAVALLRTPNCPCPYRRKFWLGARHKPSPVMVLSAGVWVFYLAIHLWGPDAYVRRESGVWLGVDILLLLAAGFFVVLNLGSIYWHEYPRFRRLRSRA